MYISEWITGPGVRVCMLRSYLPEWVLRRKEQRENGCHHGMQEGNPLP